MSKVVHSSRARSFIQQKKNFTSTKILRALADKITSRFEKFKRGERLRISDIRNLANFFSNHTGDVNFMQERRLIDQNQSSPQVPTQSCDSAR